MILPSEVTIWAIAAAATACMIAAPWRLPEAVWAVAGALLLVVLGLLPAREALAGVARGTDVYLFLIGMMLLAETAHSTGLFDWLAALATRYARGSAQRLFLAIYGVGTLVTVFLSNDATAVVLTPAVAVAVRAAGAKQPLPYLLICAFVANAASFVLPISNPANLVVYGSRMPPLLDWLGLYLVPSLLAVAATYLLLRWTQRDGLRQPIAAAVPVPALSIDGRIAAAGIAATAIVLLATSALGIPLGLPTAISGAATAALVLMHERLSPWPTLGNIDWGVLPLVAGLFVIVAALQRTGLIHDIGDLLRAGVAGSPMRASWGAGVAAALASNLMNNLPVGLIGGTVVAHAGAPAQVTSAVLIGVDLGPNLSVTGSLATILWLAALRREKLRIGAGAFLRIGVVVMPPALLLALAAAMIFA
jgi:arsenical pump membrane protein